MEENPQRPTREPPLAPLWLRVASLPIIMLGMVLLLFLIGAMQAAMQISKSRAEDVLFLFSMSAAGSVLVWVGVKMRQTLRIQFTIRDMLWATLWVAVSCAAWRIGFSGAWKASHVFGQLWLLSWPAGFISTALAIRAVLGHGGDR